jgi:hypothetical protein
MKNNRSNFLANKIFVRKMEEEGNFMGEMFEDQNQELIILKKLKFHPWNVTKFKN